MSGDRQKPLGKDFAKKIFDAYDRMEQATVELSRLEDILEEVCQEIKSSLGFDFVSISLIYPERNSIEASYGIGIAKNWSGRAGHHIEEDPDLRDIQADIVQNCQNPCRTEIISGWDDRFDRGIYEEQKHDQLVRVYTPIVLVRDKNSKPKEDWVDDFKRVVSQKKKPDGLHITVNLHLNNVPREDIEGLSRTYGDKLGLLKKTS